MVYFQKPFSFIHYIRTAISQWHFRLSAPKNIQMNFNWEIENMFIIEQVYSSHCMYKLHFYISWQEFKAPTVNNASIIMQNQQEE